MPSPSSSEPRRTEVLLKRLLWCCEQAASAEGADWARSPQAQFDVDTAQDLVTQLAASGCAAFM